MDERLISVSRLLTQGSQDESWPYMAVHDACEIPCGLFEDQNVMVVASAHGGQSRPPLKDFLPDFPVFLSAVHDRTSKGRPYRDPFDDLRN